MNKFKTELKNKKFVITCEIAPPRGTDTVKFLEAADLLKNKVTAINVTDNQRATLKLGSLVASYLVLQQGGEPIYQLTCRDRNRIAQQSDLLSASVLGIKNVLALSGDHPQYGDFPEAKPVFDLDATLLLQTISYLNEGKDLNEKDLKGCTDFFAGAVVNPGQQPIEPQLLTFEKKVSVGAKFFQTQAIFEVEKFKQFYDYAKKFSVYILAGILLLKSEKQANFLNTKVPGVFVPPVLIERLKNSPSPEKEGINIAIETINKLRTFCDGVHIMAVGDEKKILEVVEGVSGLEN